MRLRIRRHRRPSLLVEAYDTAGADDWTAIRDVMSVRGGAKRRQQDLFIRSLAVVVAALALAGCVLIVYFIHAHRAALLRPLRHSARTEAGG